MNVKERIDQYAPHAVELRRALHRNPELSLHEIQTTDLIRRELESYGISIVDSGLETGLIAEIHGTKPGSGKTAAVRADIDALPVQEETGLDFCSQIPGVSHACGHDLHTAALLLAARVLKEMESEFSGTVRLLFQPAEETGRGAHMMIEHGAMANPLPDVVLGIHTWPDTPAGMIGVRPGASHASSDTITIKVKGKGGHGAHPYRCVDPIIVSAYLLTQLQSIVSRELPMVEGGVLTFGLIRGGTAANVIPGEVELQGTLRTLNAKWREEMIASIQRIAKSCCEAMRAQAEVTIKEGMPVLYNTPEIIEGIRSSANTVLGPDCVQELPAASPGSDDFSCYLALTPGALFRMGTGNEDPATHVGLHNGGNRFDERGIATGGAVIAQYLLDFLQG
ncbi:M20 family metallopeptidase [Flavonifractor sp. An100]|uniref:M20 metallopeptidase family protein n=1 Tax=Flavonifractor sp. An100 TaxID=1965538 RepID=UPI000B38505E|nr:M20 family metallopeptidase [Flavonifractor sp. An100]OUQ77916.1 amidohydrolase [Flavonifractor sp. An100]